MSTFPKSELLSQFPETRKKSGNSNSRNNTNISINVSFPGSTLIDNFITREPYSDLMFNNKTTEKLFVIDLPPNYIEKFGKKYLFLTQEQFLMGEEVRKNPKSLNNYVNYPDLLKKFSFYVDFNKGMQYELNIRNINKRNKSFDLYFDNYFNQYAYTDIYRYKYNMGGKISSGINLEQEAYIVRTKYDYSNPSFNKNIQPEINNNTINNYNIIYAKFDRVIEDSGFINLNRSNMSSSESTTSLSLNSSRSNRSNSGTNTSNPQSLSSNNTQSTATTPSPNRSRNNIAIDKIFLVEIPDTVKAKLGITVKYFAFGEKQFISSNTNSNYTTITFDQNIGLKSIEIRTINTYTLSYTFTYTNGISEVYDYNSNAVPINISNTRNTNNIANNYIGLVNYDIGNNNEIYLLLLQDDL